MGLVVLMKKSRLKVGYLRKIRMKIPGGAGVIKYLKRKPKKKMGK